MNNPTVENLRKLAAEIRTSSAEDKNSEKDVKKLTKCAQIAQALLGLEMLARKIRG